MLRGARALATKCDYSLNRPTLALAVQPKATVESSSMPLATAGCLSHLRARLAGDNAESLLRPPLLRDLAEGCGAQDLETWLFLIRVDMSFMAKRRL